MILYKTVHVVWSVGAIQYLKYTGKLLFHQSSTRHVDGIVTVVSCRPHSDYTVDQLINCVVTVLSVVNNGDYTSVF